ncbi:proline-rich receptor-like protein kinase PERK1 [Parachaetomium inaequale]|uniref:Proline-rich receptor-like protein kinase PERK1 n=1 Tax=Parachaetomium inaequale TaxID=2588326 RepID=A0AAN6PLZ3_9PEZI|nr:proline-rich receptor-like protein kinase PERK1 [Parachaetomium inaequale]
MRLSAALVALGSAPALGRMEFRNPAAFSGLVEPSKNPVRVVGSELDLKWTASQEGKKLSVVLYQVNATRAASFNGEFTPDDDGDMEFITHDQVGATSFPWLVVTRKDLSASPVFAIAVWEEGAGVTDSATDLFNITKAEASSSATSASSTSLSSASSASSASSSSVSSTTSPSTTPSSDPNATVDSTSSQSTPAAEQSTGLSTGAAAGVGIGAGLGAIFLVGAGWYLARRRARGRELAAQGYAQPDKYYYTGPPTELNAATPPVEAPSMSYRPHELQ